MKKVTSVTTFTTEVGEVLALTYSEIDDEGNIVKRNEKMQKVVMDKSVLSAITTLKKFAQQIVDSQE